MDGVCFMLAYLWLIKVPPQESSLLSFGPLRILRRALHGLRRSTMPPTRRKLLSHDCPLKTSLLLLTMMAHLIIMSCPNCWTSQLHSTQVQPKALGCSLLWEPVGFGLTELGGPALQPGSVLKMKRLLHTGPSAFAGCGLFPLWYATPSSFWHLLFSLGFWFGLTAHTFLLWQHLFPVIFVSYFSYRGTVYVIYVLIDCYAYIHIAVVINVCEGWFNQAERHKKKILLHQPHMSAGHEWLVLSSQSDSIKVTTDYCYDSMRLHCFPLQGFEVKKVGNNFNRAKSEGKKDSPFLMR